MAALDSRQHEWIFCTISVWFSVEYRRGKQLTSMPVGLPVHHKGHILNLSTTKE